VTLAIMRATAQAATDAINGNTFSLPVEAVRGWRIEQDIEATEDFALTVVPASKQGTRLNRGGTATHNVPVSFTLKRMRAGGVNDVERDDEIADLMQEIENFILVTPITVDGVVANVTGDFSLEMNQEDRDGGVMSLMLTVQYQLVR
jgi:hypothetical protein